MSAPTVHTPEGKEAFRQRIIKAIAGRAHGTLCWYDALGASLYFTPVTMLNDTMYVQRIDGEGNTTLYAVSTTDGSVLWHASGINQLSPPIAG